MLDFFRVLLSFFGHAIKYVIDRLPCEQFFAQFGVVPMAFLILKQESKALGHSQLRYQGLPAFPANLYRRQIDGTVSSEQ